MDSNPVINKGIQRFSGGIAHDLNNIIMVLEGFSGVLRKSSGITEKQKGYINQIDKATGRVSEISDILLTICERSVLNMSYFSLQDCIRTFAEEKKGSKDFHHKIELESEVDDLKIYFDKSRMQTVLENLYANSIYPDEESRYISYKITRIILSETDASGLPSGVYNVLDVYDDGPGIDDEISSEIFNPYFSTKPRGRGKGLGLSVCAGIIGQCGAFIENIRSIEKGCLFRIYFPDDSIPVQTKKTVLLLYGDDLLRELLKEALLKAGYTVYASSSAEGGLTLFNNFHVDVIVTDITLPDSNGYDFVRKIQNSGDDMDIIFLISNPAEKHDSAEKKPYRFLTKPVKPGALIKEINNIYHKEQRFEKS